MRDRRKELIRQWLKEPTGSEHELIRKGNVEPHHHNHHSAKPEYAFNCPRQEKREGLACVKDSGKIKVEHVNHNEPSRINKNPLHDHDQDQERSKYRKMLVQFMESQNRVFCFPPQLNSFQRMLVHVEAGKLGLEHRSCGQGWERFMVVTKPGNSNEACKSESVESGGNECGDAEEAPSFKLSSQNLPSLASKLSQVMGRGPPKVEGEVKLKEGSMNIKGDICKDSSQQDQNQPHERTEAGPKTKNYATVPSSALPDDPNEIQRLRAEFEMKALIFPDDDKDLPSECESVLTFASDSSQKPPTLKDADAAESKTELVQVPTHSALISDHCTLTMPLSGGSLVEESLLQKLTDDLAWFDNLISIEAVGQVVKHEQIFLPISECFQLNWIGC